MTVQPLDALSAELLEAKPVHMQNENLREKAEKEFNQAREKVLRNFLPNANVVTLDSTRISDAEKIIFNDAARNALTTAFASFCYRISSGARDVQEQIMEQYRESRRLHRDGLPAACRPGNIPSPVALARKFISKDVKHCGNTPGDVCVASWRKRLRGKSDEELLAVFDMLNGVMQVSPRHQADVEVKIANLKSKQQVLTYWRSHTHTDASTCCF